MMRKIKPNHFLALLLSLFISSYSIGQEEQETSESRYRGMNVGNQTRILKSKINTKNYKLYVSLPDSYSYKKEKNYPVLYMLDGQWDFAHMVSIAGIVKYDGLAPELIIIGVSYGKEDGKNANYSTLRSNDMTPSIIEQVHNSGGAKQFTKVLREEIIPFIDKEYRTSEENRTLAGTSFGGLYTHYALFNANDLFHNYIICNPSYWYDNEWSYKNEENYFKKNNSLNANVYLVSGSLDNVKAHDKMAKQIKSRNYKNLNFESHISEGFGHGGAKAEGYAKGLLHVFKIRGITLPKEQLQKYTGTYEIRPDQRVSLIIHEGHLAIKEFRGDVNIPIYTISENKFSLEGRYRTFEFNKNDAGKVISITVETDPNRFVTVNKVE